MKTDKGVHAMTLRMPKDVHDEAVVVADGRALNLWIVNVVRKAIEEAKKKRKP